MPVAIAGMHRAGTSMVARILQMCGLDLGSDEHFAPPAPDNTEGFWEDLRFVAWNERILETFEGAWDTVPSFPPGWPSDPRLQALRDEADAMVAARQEPWGWKDPRTSVTAPFWIERLPGLRFVICVRHPLEVADSLRARGYTSERYGLRLWETYHRALDQAVDPAQAIVTHYDSYFVDAAAEIDRVADFAGLALSAPLRKAAAVSASIGVRHQRRAARDLDRVGVAVRRLYQSLCERGGPVLAAAAAREDTPGGGDAAPAAPQPAPHDPALELETLKTVLAAREEELASVKFVLAAREEELASIRPVLAARDEELASVKFVLAARDEELANVKPLLAAREEELLALEKRRS
jgi:Sulfotransferase family